MTIYYPDTSPEQVPDKASLRRMLDTRSEEYQEMRRAYLEDPQGVAESAGEGLALVLEQYGINWGLGGLLLKTLKTGSV